MNRSAWVLAPMVVLLTVLGGKATAGAGAPLSPGRDDFVTTAVISGGGLAGEVRVEIELSTVATVAYGETHSTLTPESYDLRNRTLLPMTYAISVHYDLAEIGWGEYDREGFYDGVNVLQFPEPKIMGNGVWAAGFYRASPEFAAQLQAALSSAITPPSTGDAGLVR